MDLQEERQGQAVTTDRITIGRIEPQAIPQGWQCPKCQRIHSPSKYICDYCAVGGGVVTETRGISPEVEEQAHIALRNRGGPAGMV